MIERKKILSFSLKLKELLKIYHHKHIRSVVDGTAIVLNNLSTSISINISMSHRFNKFVNLNMFYL